MDLFVFDLGRYRGNVNGYNFPFIWMSRACNTTAPTPAGSRVMREFEEFRLVYRVGDADQFPSMMHRSRSAEACANLSASW
jgi:hypothetical protein